MGRRRRAGRRYARRRLDRRGDRVRHRPRERSGAAASFSLDGRAPPGIDAVAQFRGHARRILVGQNTAHSQGAPAARAAAQVAREHTRRGRIVRHIQYPCWRTGTARLDHLKARSELYLVRGPAPPPRGGLCKRATSSSRAAMAAAALAILRAARERRRRQLLQIPAAAVILPGAVIERVVDTRSPRRLSGAPILERDLLEHRRHIAAAEHRRRGRAGRYPPSRARWLRASCRDTPDGRSRCSPPRPRPDRPR